MNPKAMNRIAYIVLKVLLIRGECHCMEEGQDGGEIYLLDLTTNYVVSEFCQDKGIQSNCEILMTDEDDRR